MRALFCLPQVENRFMGKDKRFRSKEGIFEDSSSDLRCECECAGEKGDRGRCLEVFRNAALVICFSSGKIPARMRQYQCH